MSAGNQDIAFGFEAGLLLRSGTFLGEFVLHSYDFLIEKLDLG